MDWQEYRFLVCLHGNAWTGLDMEDIVLVTGCHRTRSWSNVAFAEVHTNAQFSLGVEVTGAFGANINWRASNDRMQGAVLSQGPSGEVSGTWMIFRGSLRILTCSLRTYLRINAYLSEGFVSNVYSGYFHVSKERQNPGQIHVGMTANKRCKLSRCLILLR